MISTIIDTSNPLMFQLETYIFVALYLYLKI